MHDDNIKEHEAKRVFYATRREKEVQNFDAVK